MLPRFAAMVWSAMKGISRSVRPIAFRISTAKGTKVMSDTSFVTSMEVKNGSSTSISVTRSRLPRPESSRCSQNGEEAAALQPVHNRHQAEQQAEHPQVYVVRIPRPGGTASMDKSAAAADITSTGSRRKNAVALFKAQPPHSKSA